MESGSVVPAPHAAGPLRLTPFVALSLAPTRIGDPSSARALARPYAEVPARLARWERRGQLRRRPAPAVYLHEYTSGGITVRGLVGLLDVSRRARSLADRAVLPHEGIYPAQADDLALRMEQMRLDPAPILLVHRGSTSLRELVREVAAEPAETFADRAGQRHRLWAIEDAATLRRLDEALAPGQAVIADGHHRYAAYLRLQQRSPGGASDAGLAMLVDQEDTPLFLGAIHRVCTGTSVPDLEAAARSLDLRAGRRTRSEAIAALSPTTLVATDGETWLVVQLGERGGDRPVVQVLHDELVPAFPHGPRRTTFHHSAEAAIAHAAPAHAVAVLVPAPDVAQVLRVVQADRLLPEKATSFQPKPSLGVFIRPWPAG